MAYPYLACGRQQSDIALLDRLRQRFPSLGILLQFRTVAPLELLPLFRIVPVPFAQSRARSNLPHPNNRSQCVLANSARPEAIHQKSRALVRRCLLVNPPDTDIKFSALSSHTWVRQPPAGQFISFPCRSFPCLFGSLDVRCSPSRRSQLNLKISHPNNSFQPPPNLMRKADHFPCLDRFEIFATVEFPQLQPRLKVARIQSEAHMFRRHAAGIGRRSARQPRPK
jgi:hypothetical protein